MYGGCWPRSRSQRRRWYITAAAKACRPTCCPVRRPAAGAGPLLVEQLTVRELQVLALLGEPLSPKEIARTLDISHGTMKRHVANIYGKLDVTTRWDAVAQAKALGLLATG